ncbi:cupin domain-containing protein [uncultured Desulfuromonas sp.]|uniref:cupin domain-containing protein n=1 Tax=uncultured Desulfuromonas sp. TaxID=181013 RepID=UPI00261EBEAF|nr:cupin domain-containing protein [uncultured Desulfuromonas sp.]
MYDKRHFDWDKLPPLTSPRRMLGLKGVALGLINLPPGQGYTFTHSHREQEEVYMVLEGEGILLVDGEELPLGSGDMVRVDPESKRALNNNGRVPLRIICAGGVPAGYPKHPEARYLIDDGRPDYDDVPPWCANDPEVAANNARLKKRYQASLAKRAAAPRKP